MNEDLLYYKFENRFRGSRENVDAILSNYDTLLKRIKIENKSQKVLDIGCGRGEWLLKCRQFGFECVGIEKNTEMIDICQKYNLSILKGDFLKYLEDLEGNSFAIISAFHIIEHLSFSEINSLLLQSKRLLTEEGIMILETPSIDNLIVASKNFYLDPTHITPINPDLLIYKMQEFNFYKAKYFFINGGPLQDTDQLKLTRILNGVSQDISIIATSTDQLGGNFWDDNSPWFENLNLGISTIEASVAYDQSFMKKIKYLEEQIAHLNTLINTQNTFYQRKNDLIDSQIEYILQRQNKIFNSIPFRLFRKGKKILPLLKLKFFPFFKKGFYFTIKNLSNVYYHYLLIRSRFYLIMLTLFIKIARQLKLISISKNSQRIYQYVLQRYKMRVKTKNINSFIYSSSNEHKELLDYFEDSQYAKFIFNEIVENR